MPAGTPVNRQWVVVLHDGSVVIDWGNNVFQDTLSGNFISCSEAQISHTIREAELDWLKRSGQVADFDDRLAYFLGLPERPIRTID